MQRNLRRMTMDREVNPFRTPGQLIQQRLEERGWTQRALSVILDVGETSITRLVSGKQPLNAAFAVALEDVLGVSAEQLLQLQSDLELAGARAARRPDARLCTRARLYGDLPLPEMIKRGWIDADDIRDTQNVDAALANLFGVEDIEEIAPLPGTAGAPGALAHHAWACRVGQIASQADAAAYAPQAVDTAIAHLRGLLGTFDAIARVPQILAACGIRLVLVESLPKSGVDGTSLWLGERSPVIGLSLRHDRIDSFWLLLRHELEHIARRDSRAAPLLDMACDGERWGSGAPEQERAADAAAQEFCVPSPLLDDFIARKAPFISTRDLTAFAADLGVHPGILAGRIQALTRPCSHFSPFLVKVRAALAPHAQTDGWEHTTRRQARADAVARVA
jgi:HTH-type transcriptional regulator/antitoxin HigA